MKKDIRTEVKDYTKKYLFSIKMDNNLNSIGEAIDWVVRKIQRKRR